METIKQFKDYLIYLFIWLRKIKSCYNIYASEKIPKEKSIPKEKELQEKDYKLSYESTKTQGNGVW